MKFVFFIVLFFLNLAVFAAKGEGALIRVQMRSTVGVFVDDIPHSIKDKAIANFLNKPEKFWKKNLRNQRCMKM